MNSLPVCLIINKIEPYTRNSYPNSILEDIRNYNKTSEEIYSLYLNAFIQNRKADLLDGYYIDSIYSLYRFMVNDIIQYINLRLTKTHSKIFDYQKLYFPYDEDYDQKKFKYIFNILWRRFTPSIRQDFHDLVKTQIMKRINA